MAARIFALALMFVVCGLLPNNVKADIAYTSSAFENMVITQNDAFGFAITADVTEAGITTGVLTASYTYGAGSTPFNTGENWGGTSNFRIPGTTNLNPDGTDTASGDWNISVTALAGYQVDGLSVFTQGTSISNPDFTNITSNGIATVCEASDLISNVSHGDVIPNGGNLDFNAGTSANGIISDDHSQEWAINVAGSALSFTYLAGFDEPVNNVANEGLRLDVQISEAVPEPSSFAIIGLGMVFIGMRRRR